MRSFVNEIASTIASKISGSVAVRNVVVVRHSNHFVQGFLVERRSIAKSFHLWQLVLPLFTPLKVVTLNYSERVTSAGAGQEGLIGSEAMSSLTSRFTSESAFGPRDFFLKYSGMMSLDRPAILLDLAIACYLAGDEGGAKEMLRGLCKRSPRNEHEQFVLSTAAQFLSASVDATAVEALASEYERDNIERLLPTLSSSSSKTSR